MKLPSLSLKTLTDKWVLIGLAAGAGIYLFTTKRGHGFSHIPGHTTPRDSSPKYFPDYDRPGLYEVPSTGFDNMRFSGQAELQRRLTIS